MKFSDIRPFVRYARYMTSLPTDTRLVCTPYDSRAFYTVSGDGQICADGVEYRMSGGALLLLPAATQYSIIPQAKEVRYAILNFDYTYAMSSAKTPIPPAQNTVFDKGEAIFAPHFEDSETSNGVIYMKNAMPLGEAVCDIVREYSRGMLYFEEKCSAQLAALLFEIHRRKGTGGVYFDTRIDEILAYIDKHFAEDLSNKKIAEVFSFHPNHISAVIKQSTGMPLHKYLINTRLRHAIYMLDTGEKNISAIAEECGFFDAAHFSRTFKSVFGCNPKNYALR